MPFQASSIFACDFCEQWSFHKHNIKSFLPLSLDVFQTGNKIAIWNRFHEEYQQLFWHSIANKIILGLFSVGLETVSTCLSPPQNYAVSGIALKFLFQYKYTDFSKNSRSAAAPSIILLNVEEWFTKIWYNNWLSFQYFIK